MEAMAAHPQGQATTVSCFHMHLYLSTVHSSYTYVYVLPACRNQDCRKDGDISLHAVHIRSYVHRVFTGKKQFYCPVNVLYDII